MILTAESVNLIISSFIIIIILLMAMMMITIIDEHFSGFLVIMFQRNDEIMS